MVSFKCAQYLLFILFMCGVILPSYAQKPTVDDVLYAVDIKDNSNIYELKVTTERYTGALQYFEVERTRLVEKKETEKKKKKGKKEEKRRGGGKKKERRKRERVNNRHTVPPTAKVSAFSRNGGTGADPAVNNASSAHKRTATNPMLVAVARVISFG